MTQPSPDASRQDSDLRPADEGAVERPPPVNAEACPLNWPEQRRNLILFAACTGLQYFAAPILYVGITQASLCDRLGADARTANLPATLYFAMTASPALIAWISPRIAMLKRNLVLCYLIEAVAMAAVAITLAWDVSKHTKLMMVLVQGAVSGIVMPAAVAFLWEAVGRGSEESRRGLALSLAFGLGPVLAVLGSLAQVGLLGGELFGYVFDGLGYPTGFVVLFGMGVPTMLIAAFLAGRFVVPIPEQDLEREPLSSVNGLLVGMLSMFFSLWAFETAPRTTADQGVSLWIAAAYGSLVLSAAAFIYHFRGILMQRVLLVATVVTILVYSGNTITSNMNLYTTYILDALPATYAGLQNTLRFAFKMVAGLLLGWLLTRTNPRAGLLATSAIFIAAQVWAIFATGQWYLLAFGLYGAGELVGVYAPNYILSASQPAEIRRNMAFVTMLMVPAAPTGYLYGTIADVVGKSQVTWFGVTNSAALGFQVSFAVCAALMSAGVVICVLLLPRRPTKRSAGL